MIGSATTNPVVTVNPRHERNPGPTASRICFTDPRTRGLVMASYFVSERSGQDGGHHRRRGQRTIPKNEAVFHRDLEKLGGTVAGSWGFRGGDVDFRAQLTRGQGEGTPGTGHAVFFTRKWRSPSSRRRSWISPRLHWR